MSVPHNLTRVGNSYGSEATPITDKVFDYGTTGFRMAAKFLPCPCFRVSVYGALATLAEAVKTGSSVTSGIMITASHNVYTDNGVKAYAAGGSYYTHEQINFLTKIVNMSDTDFENFAATEMKSLKLKYEEELTKSAARPSFIVIGYDTRKSSMNLAKYAQIGVDFVGSSFLKCIILPKPVTTPLHQILLRSNVDFKNDDCLTFLEKYASSLAQRMPRIVGNNRTIVDCANGVGVYWAKYYFPDHSADKFDVVNGDVDCFEKLNDNSGADYVKSTGKCPANCEKLPALDRIASLDGDCDRLIYSFYNSKGDFCVVDGDFQAILFASFIYEKLCEMNLDDEARKNFTFGIATTRYANGALDKALQKYSDWLQIMKGETGVANISRLINKLDVGIFFEANGHGSVFLSKKAVDLFKSKKSPLADFAVFFEHPVGDGLSNMLAIEFIMASSKLQIDEWHDKFYTPLENSLKKVHVKNLNDYKLDSSDTAHLLTPKAVREFAKNMMVSEDCRIYIRPSGTEPCVRVYVEAVGEERVNKIMRAVEDEIAKYENGISV